MPVKSIDRRSFLRFGATLGAGLGVSAVAAAVGYNLGTSLSPIKPNEESGNNHDISPSNLDKIEIEGHGIDFEVTTELDFDRFPIRTDLSIADIQTILHSNFGLSLGSFPIPPESRIENGGNWQEVNKLSLGVARHVLSMVDLANHYYGGFVRRLTANNQISLNLHAGRKGAGGKAFGKNIRFMDTMIMHNCDMHEGVFASGTSFNWIAVQILLRTFIHEGIHLLDVRQGGFLNKGIDGLNGLLNNEIQKDNKYRVDFTNNEILTNWPEVLAYMGEWYALNPHKFSNRFPELAEFYKQKIFQ